VLLCAGSSPGLCPQCKAGGWDMASGWFAQALGESGLQGSCVLFYFCKGSQIPLEKCALSHPFTNTCTVLCFCKHMEQGWCQQKWAILFDLSINKGQLNERNILPKDQKAKILLES